MKKFIFTIIFCCVSILSFGQELTFDSEQNFVLSKVVEINGSKDKIYGAIMETINPVVSSRRTNVFIDKELGTIKFTDKNFIGMLNSQIKLVEVRTNVKFHIKDNKYKVTLETSYIIVGDNLYSKLYYVCPEIDKTNVGVRLFIEYYSEDTLIELQNLLKSNIYKTIDNIMNEYVRKIKIEDDF